MNLFRLLAAASVFAMVAPTTAATAQPMQVPVKAQELTIERVFDSPSLSGSVPRSPNSRPTAVILSLLRNRTNDLTRYDLWAFDRQTSRWSMLVDSEKLGTGASTVRSREDAARAQGHGQPQRHRDL